MAASTILAVLFWSFPLVHSSYFNPHVFPSRGPFIEGWYLRITDYTSAHSFALLFGLVLPENPDKASDLGFVGLLHDDYNTGGHLENFQQTLCPDKIRITVQGHPVTENPDASSPADFRWDAGSLGWIECKGNTTEFRFQIEGILFEGIIGPPVPWTVNGEGPELWLGYFPLPLHWFVYSLRSPVQYLSWTDTITNASYIMDPSSVTLAHMEKNWGDSFPSASIWAQGLDPSSNVGFAFGYGPVKFGNIISLNGHLMGYRNPRKLLDINFMPLNSIATVSPDGCSRRLTAAFTGLQYKVTVTMEATNQSFSNCLLAPYKNGFRRSLKESYRAKAHLKVFVRKWLGLFGWRLMDTQVIQYAGLEFNEGYVCDQECGGS